MQKPDYGKLKGGKLEEVKKWRLLCKLFIYERLNTQKRQWSTCPGN